MKKLLTAILSVVFLSTLSAKAEIGVGVSGALHAFDASGTETTRQVVKKIMEATKKMLCSRGIRRSNPR